MTSSSVGRRNGIEIILHSRNRHLDNPSHAEMYQECNRTYLESVQLLFIHSSNTYPCLDTDLKESTARMVISHIVCKRGQRGVAMIEEKASCIVMFVYPGRRRRFVRRNVASSHQPGEGWGRPVPCLLPSSNDLRRSRHCSKTWTISSSQTPMS